MAGSLPSLHPPWGAPFPCSSVRRPEDSPPCRVPPEAARIGTSWPMDRFSVLSAFFPCLPPSSEAVGPVLRMRKLRLREGEATCPGSHSRSVVSPRPPDHPSASTGQWWPGYRGVRTPPWEQTPAPSVASAQLPGFRTWGSDSPRSRSPPRNWGAGPCVSAPPSLGRKWRGTECPRWGQAFS